jgi:hypothetical protein
MLVLFGVLTASAPFAVVIGLLAWTAWRERRAGRFRIARSR